VEVPDGLKNNSAEEVAVTEEEVVSDREMKRRKNLTGFWGKFKDRIIDLFKEEEDKHL
jgi:cell division protein FtsA